MRNLWWLCWYLWEGLPTLFAFPIDSAGLAGGGETWSTYWELKWPRYAIGSLSLVAVALTLGGCLCCRRQRRPKGFQDDAGNGKEFKDGSAAATETTIERVPSASLELEVSRIASAAHSSSGGGGGSKIHFEALPVDRLSSETRGTVKPKPPSPSLFAEQQEQALTAAERGNLAREQPCREWFDAENCHVPRERLKYLREIGRGWFGKVVEGTTESPSPSGPKNRGVVVRILTEEATAREKAWFLGEATPYLKLDHPNVLTLLGCCLEADPYLLLFESCPAGDLKEFLRGNRDKGTCEALLRENVPTRMALDIANALEHMHANGFAHTDLSARNCLVAPDLSAKLGDYGTGVEKYPGDYYVVGDRALPIRWSAPESLDCTETTIETRTITPRANLWSYAVLLWEMATWGERPYDDLGDEQVIEMIFSLKSDFRARGTCDALLKRLREEIAAPRNFREAVEASWKFQPEERASLKECKDMLCGKGIADFEKRWENLKPNSASAAAAAADRGRDNRSASLQDLRGSVDSELWRSSANDEKNPPQANFRLGPDEPVKNQQPRAERSSFQPNESGSETEEESWRGRVERGAYTEKVKQKSKSVADLMVLVHIDSDSDAEISLGPQINEKTQKKNRLPASGSDGDLRSHFFADEFDEAIKKLREPPFAYFNGAGSKTTKSPSEEPQLVESNEKSPKLLTLTHQGQTPILRLNFGSSENEENSKIRTIDAEKVTKADLSSEKLTTGASNENNSSHERFAEAAASHDGPVLRLVSRGDPVLPLLRYLPERTSTPAEMGNVAAETQPFDSFLAYEGGADFSSNFAASTRPENSVALGDNAVDVELWNNALAFELEKKKKNLDFEAHETIFDESLDCWRENAKQSPPSPRRSASAPATPKSVRFDAGENDSAPENPPGNDSRKIDENDVNYYENLNVASSSAPETPGKHFFQPEIAINRKHDDAQPKIDDASSSSVAEASGDESSTETAENHRRRVNDTKINEDRISEDASYREKPGGARGSYSAPETPGKHYFDPEIDATSSQDGNYYENLSAGCSCSAPETPRHKHYYEPKIDAKTNSKDASYYRDSLGSVSAPDTPQFRGNYAVAGQMDEDSSACEELEAASDRQLKGSAPDTPLSRGNYSVGNGDEDSSTGEELDAAGERMIKRSSHEIDDEEDRKHLSTPDDERSSDSGFRDKESCEEEESPVPGLPSAGVVVPGAISSSGHPAAMSSPLSASAEEEQMRILFELDTILDAEYYGSFYSSDRTFDGSEILSPGDVENRGNDGEPRLPKNRSISESLESTESTDFIETVRANSCEPDFSDSRSIREISNLPAAAAESHDEGQNFEELKKLGEFLRKEGEDDRYFHAETISDDTEADFLADSASESLKTDKNCSDLSQGISGYLPKDSSDISGKNHSRSGDSSAELGKLNVDSSSDGNFEKSNESTDLSFDLRSSGAVVELYTSKTTDNSSDSPLKSCDLSLEFERNNSEKCRNLSESTSESPRKTGSSEIFYSGDLKISTSESTSQSPLKSFSQETGNSGIADDDTKSKDFVSDSVSKNEKRNESAEISEAVKLEKSSGSPVEEKKLRDAASEISEASVQLESSAAASLSFLKSERLHGSLETNMENLSHLPLKHEKSAASTEFEILDTSLVELEKNSSEPNVNSGENPDPEQQSEKCESLVELGKNLSVNSAENPDSEPPSEKCESSAGIEKCTSDSPGKPEKPREENSSSSPTKSCEEKREKKSEVQSVENSGSDSPQKTDHNPEKIEKPQEENSSSSPTKSCEEKREKKSEVQSVENSGSDSPQKTDHNPEKIEKPQEENSSSSPTKSCEEKHEKKSEVQSAENSGSDSPQKTDHNPISDLSMETRGSDVDQWSWRENLRDNDNAADEEEGEEEAEEEEEDSSTMSLRSDNSYVSFGLDEEFVAAIRNELREKLPRAQMPVIEALDPRDDKQEPSINKDAETKQWEDEEAEENAERGSGGVDISIRYNVYGTPLSPILEERESAGTSESLISKEDSRDDASIASRVSALSEDVLVVDTRTNRAMMLEGNTAAAGNGEPNNSQHDDDRDTSHGEFSDEENLEYPHNHFNRGMENKRICMVSGGAPLPSPEEETKWQQQFPLPLQMQDDLMSTSFGTDDRDWDSQDEDEGEGEAEAEDGEEDEEENSSSSGEFVWKRYDESHGDLENVATRSPTNKPKSREPEADLEEEEEDEGGDEDDEEDEEEEFTPSAWDATLAPHRSALRSPEKTLKSGDQKKSVWFKKQRYHCVYEYPKETPVVEGQGQAAAATTWEPTSYADWEEMMDEPRLDVYPMEYDESNRAGDEEFYVSSSNRPFQFQSGEGKYVSQFFPGASSTLLQQQQPQQQQQEPPVAAPASEDNSQESQDEVDRGDVPDSPRRSQTDENPRNSSDIPETQQQQQQTQLGELRHTRDRLKLNLLSTSGAAKAAVEQNVIENSSENSQNKIPKSTETSEESSRSEITTLKAKSTNGATKSTVEKNVFENIPEKSQNKIPKSTETSGESLRSEITILKAESTMDAVEQNVIENIPKNPQNKILKSTETSAESSRSEITTLKAEQATDSEAEAKIEPKDSGNSREMNLLKSDEEMKREESLKSRSLAVEKTPRVEIHEKQVDARESEASGASSDAGAGKAPQSDDLTVIQGKYEVAQLIRDEIDSAEPRDASTGELSVEQIVDIPKLEESPAGATICQTNNDRGIVEEATIVGRVASSSTGDSLVEITTEARETTTNNVHSSES